MSDENTSEKKHQPSQKRIDELKKEGTFLRAKEFYSSSALVIAFIALYMSSTHLSQTLESNFYLIYSKLHLLIHEPKHQKVLIHQVSKNTLFAFFPFFIALISFYLLAVYFVGGINFSKKLIGFKGSRLSVIKNIKRIFSLQNLGELVKSILKVLLFIPLLLFFLHYYQYDILSLANIGSLRPFKYGFQLLTHYFIYMIFGILFIGAVDGLFNYLQYQKKIKMTDKEVKDEQKETDGNPEVKKRRRQKHLATSMQSVQKEIPNASVVITNPTHFAIALRYKEGLDKAPKILAMGADHMAIHIKTLAKKYHIPVYESPQLARAIFYTGTVGSTIHPELYMAVAIVLSYIMQLKSYQAGHGQMPKEVKELHIPDEFIKPYQNR